MTGGDGLDSGDGVDGGGVLDIHRYRKYRFMTDRVTADREA